MAKRGLTANERQVLYGLVRHPILNDRELGQEIGVKISTVTAIRRRLRSSDLFVTRRLPMMHRLGWEILAACHGRLSGATTGQGAQRLRDVLRDRFPNVFHVTAGADHVSALACAPDFTTFQRLFLELRQALHRADVLGGELYATLFPMGLSVIPNFFDYGHVLALAFGYPDRMSFRPDPSKQDPIELTPKEGEVLKGLVRFPELSDKALSGKVKVSRQAISKMRRDFHETGLLRTARLPNLRALGFELVADAWARFVPSATLKVRTESIDRTLKAAPAFFLASSDTDAVLFGAATSYEHFSALRLTITTYLEERGYLAGEPTVYVGLSSATEFVRHADFVPLMQSLSGASPIHR